MTITQLHPTVPQAPLHVPGGTASPARRRAAKAVTAEDLPPANTVRWVPRRKAAVVAAIRNGLLTRSEAKCRYNISEQELQLWECGIDNIGTHGLRVTRSQCYRPIFGAVDLGLDRVNAYAGR
jgi:hypothetical protein